MGTYKDDFAEQFAELFKDEPTHAHASQHQEGGTDPVTPALHASRHENAGADEISVLGLSGLLADPQTPLELTLQIASDAAVAVLDTTKAIYLTATTSGAKAAALTSARPGQVIPILCFAASGGSYTFAVLGGNLTFDAAGEIALLVRNAANDGWLGFIVAGATIV